MGFNSNYTPPAANGAEYTGVPGLSVTPDGTTYTNTLPSSDFFYDGTTNGMNNFTVGTSAGNVYKTSTTWGGGTLLFSTGNANDIGITYEASNNSLWVQNFITGLLTDYTMGGVVITSFTPSVTNPGLFSALAMDTDGTLWFENGNGVLEHYATNGMHLGTLVVPELDAAFGGEIGAVSAAAIPEPSTVIVWLLLGGIGLGLGYWRRKRAA